MKLLSILCMFFSSLFTQHVVCDSGPEISDELNNEWSCTVTGFSFKSRDVYSAKCLYSRVKQDKTEKLVILLERFNALNHYPKTFLTSYYNEFFHDGYELKSYPRNKYTIVPKRIASEDYMFCMQFDIYEKGWVSKSLRYSDFVCCRVFDGQLQTIKYRVGNKSQHDKKWIDFTMNEKCAIVDSF